MAALSAVKSQRVIVYPIYAEFGDCIAIQVITEARVEHYLIDGGPTTSPTGRPPKVYQYLFRYLTSHCLQPPNTTNFSLNGIVVTHTDSDHIDGIIKLFEHFPPNAAKHGSFKLVFNGPVLITDYFNTGKSVKGNELIASLTKTKTPFEEETLDDNPFSINNFKFYFQEENKGLILKYSPPSKAKKVGPVPDRKMKAVKARYTIDDSKPNLSSIISTWSLDGKCVLLLTGDAPGYRVLEVLKALSPRSSSSLTSGEIPEVSFFQVPHHGSARNSLPLEANQLPPTEDITVLQHLVLFRVILGYCISGKLDGQQKQELLDTWVGTKLMTTMQKKLDFDVVMNAFGKAIIEALNQDKYKMIENPTSSTKADYIYTQTVDGLEEISGRVSAYIDNPTSFSSEDIFKIGKKHLFKTNRYLYRSTSKCAFESLKSDPTVSDKYTLENFLLVIDAPKKFMDELLTHRVTEFYKKFRAKIYYISSSTNHGHPSSATLSGIIKAAIAKDKQTSPGSSPKKDVLLLSTGYALTLRTLPDYETWKNLVTIKYFTRPYAQVDPESMDMENTEEFIPGRYDHDQIVRLMRGLRSGAASRFFASCQPKMGAVDMYIKVTSQEGAVYFLDLEEDNADVQFIARKTTRTKLKVHIYPFDPFDPHRGTLVQLSKDLQLSRLGKEIHIEPCLYKKDMYTLFDVDQEERKLYWSIPTAAISPTVTLSMTDKMTSSVKIEFIKVMKRGPPDSPPGKKRLAPLSKLVSAEMPKNEQTTSLKQYLQLVGVSYPCDGIEVNKLFDLLLGSVITKQIEQISGPPDVTELVSEALRLTASDSSVVTNDDEVVSSASIVVKLPDEPPSFLKIPLQEIAFNVTSPRTKALSLDMKVSFSEGRGEATFHLTKQLDVSSQEESLSKFLSTIKFATDDEETTFGDMALLFAGSFFAGLSNFHSFPLSLAEKAAAWKVDSLKSNVKTFQLTSGPVVTSASICAKIPKDDPSITFKDFKIDIKELVLEVSSAGKVYQLTGTGILHHQSATPVNVEFISEPSKEGKTPEINIQFDNTVTLLDVLAILKLNSQLVDAHAPFLSSAMKGVALNSLGFTLKQGIPDSADNYYIHSVFLSIDFSNCSMSSLLPTGILPSIDGKCRLLIFSPTSKNPTVGCEIKFTASIGTGSGGEVLKFPCKASILPVEASEKEETSGYTCFLRLSTALYSQQGHVVGTPSIVSIFSALGLGTQFKQLSSSIPVVGSFLKNVSLKNIEITFNTATHEVESFYLQLAVPKWTVYGEISLSNFDLELQYSEAEGWEANLQSDILLGNSYYVTVRFSLPKLSKPGELSFHNSHEDLTVAKIFSFLPGFPILSDLPVLGSILDVTVKQVCLGFETEHEALGLYGVKLEFYIKSLNLQVFQLTDVNVIIAYNQAEGGPEVSFRAFGYINEKAFIEISYDPSSSQFTGHLQVTTFKELSVSDTTKLLLGNASLQRSTPFETIASKTSVDITLGLMYDSSHKTVSLQKFHILLDNVSQLTFGPLILGHFSLTYTKQQSSTAAAPSSSASLLPSGSELELVAVLTHTGDQFGLQLSFDCTVSDKNTNTMMAKIKPIPNKKISIRSFLALNDIKGPQLPDSGSSSQPSSEGLLDLELVSGSITFEVLPTKKLKAFEITTAFASEGWMLLDAPRIKLSNVRLSISYDEEKKECIATLSGTVTIGNVEVTLTGTRSNETTTFKAQVSASSNVGDLMQIVNGLSPPDKQNELSIPKDVGLSQTLSGSIGTLTVVLAPEKQTVDTVISLDLESWDLNLEFAKFTAKQLKADLHWEKMVRKQCDKTSGQVDVPSALQMYSIADKSLGDAPDKEKMSSELNPPLSKYVLKLTGHFSFDSIPVVVELDIGSTQDSIVQAVVNNPSAIRLDSITDKALGFAPDKKNTSTSSPCFTDLLPQKMASIEFTSGYLQFNLTRKIFILLGSVKDVGTCMLIAGSLESSSENVGYAVTFSLSNLSSLLPPLKAVEDVISVKNVNASIVNLGTLNTSDLVAAITLAESHLSPCEHESSCLPFKNLPIAPGSKADDIPMQTGVSMYCQLFVSESAGQLFKNLAIIQSEKKIPSIILYAHYKGGSGATEATFIAMVPTFTLFGAFEFREMKLRYAYHYETSSTNAVHTLSLSGNVSVPQISSAVFRGSLSIKDKETNFSLVGDDQPINIKAPLSMFGITIKHPRLSLKYHYPDEDTFPDGKKFHSEFILSGQVEFGSSPVPVSDSDSHELGSDSSLPALTLAGKCIWKDGSPTVISIELDTVDKPLTLTDLVATVFGQAWDSSFIDIGLYDGKMYYATEDVTISTEESEFIYKKGYRIACTTFIFKRSFAFTVDVSLESSGFEISGSPLHPIDFGIVKLSTKDQDDQGNFKDLGPTLSYKHTESNTKISLDVGITILDVQVAATTITYDPSEKEFQFSVKYPNEFLGLLNKPEVSCAWSREKGFRITSWSLGSPDIPGFDLKLIEKFQELANVPTADGCEAICDFIFREVDLVKTKFDIGMQTADQHLWGSDDLVALQVGGTYSISFGKQIEIASVPLLNIIIVHVHKPADGSIRTMSDVAEYILQEILSNVGSIAQQILTNPEHLAQLLSVLAFDQLIKQGSKKVISSFICRGLTENQVSKAGVNASSQVTQAVQATSNAAEGAFESFTAAAVSGGLAAITISAGEVVVAYGAFVAALTGLAAICSFFGGQSKHEDLKKEHDKRLLDVARKMGVLLTLNSPLTAVVDDDKLTLSWPLLEGLRRSGFYEVVVTIVNPVEDTPAITMQVAEPRAIVADKNIWLASSITVEVTATVTIKDHTFRSGKSLSITISHQASLPPPHSVILEFNVSEQSIIASVKGIHSGTQAMKAVLLGIDTDGKQHTLLSKQLDRTSDSMQFEFARMDYIKFSGRGFKVQVQSLQTGLQSSTFTESDMIAQLLPLSHVSHSLPVLGDPHPCIIVNWTLPTDSVNAGSILCQIINELEDVLLSKVIPKADDNSLPSTGSLSLSEIEDNLQLQAKYRILISLTSGSVSNVSSAFSNSNTEFSVAAPPSDVSASFSNESLNISWALVSNTDEYVMQILDGEKHDIILTRVIDTPSGIQRYTHYLSSDISELTPGKSYNIQVYSFGNSSSLLSSLTATTFANTVMYLPTLRNLFVSYHVKDDSVQFTFDGEELAKGYTLVVQCEYASRNSWTTYTYDIPLGSEDQPVNYTIPVSKFRPMTTYAQPDSIESYGFEVRAIGMPFDILSPYLKAEKTWKLAQRPHDVTYTYSPDDDQLTVMCQPVSNFTTYRIMIINDSSMKIVTEKNVQSISGNPPMAQWKGEDLKEGGQCVCVAQTVGTEDIFSSKPAICFDRLTVLGTPSAPAFHYKSDVRGVELSYQLVKNALSYYFKLDIVCNAYKPEESRKTLETLTNFKPTPSDKDVTVTFDLSNVCISPGDRLEVTSVAMGGNCFLNSKEGVYGGNVVQFPGKLRLEYDCARDTLEWNSVSPTYFYSFRIVNTNTSQIVYEEPHIESTHVSLVASKLASQGEGNMSVSVTAHSQEGPKPLLPVNQEVKVEKIVEKLQVNRGSSSIAIVEWTICDKWKGDVHTKFSVVTKGDEQEIEAKALGYGSHSVSMSGLSDDQKYTVTLLSSRNTGIGPPLIGIPLFSEVPDASPSRFNYFSHVDGLGVEISGSDATIITRTGNLDASAVVYTALPIPVGSIFQLKMIHPSTFRFGLTNRSPESAPHSSPNHGCFCRPYWEADFNMEEDESEDRVFKVGHTMGLALLNNGELHLYNDDMAKPVRWRIPQTDDRPLRGFVDLKNAATNSSFKLVCYAVKYSGGSINPGSNYFSSYREHGPVKLEEDSTVVASTSSNNAVAYTFLPIPIGRLYQLNVITPGIISFGLTIYPPESAPVQIKYTSQSGGKRLLFDLQYESVKFDYWVWFNSYVYHGGKPVPVGYNIQESDGMNLKVDQTLAMAVLPNGELHVYTDGKDVGTPWKNLPTDKPLYGVVEVGSYSSFKLGCGESSIHAAYLLPEVLVRVIPWWDNVSVKSARCVCRTWRQTIDSLLALREDFSCKSLNVAVWDTNGLNSQTFHINSPMPGYFRRETRSLMGFNQWSNLSTRKLLQCGTIICFTIRFPRTSGLETKFTVPGGAVLRRDRIKAFKWQRWERQTKTFYDLHSSSVKEGSGWHSIAQEIVKDGVFTYEDGRKIFKLDCAVPPEGIPGLFALQHLTVGSAVCMDIANLYIIKI